MESAMEKISKLGGLEQLAKAAQQGSDLDIPEPAPGFTQTSQSFTNDEGLEEVVVTASQTNIRSPAQGSNWFRDYLRDSWTMIKANSNARDIQRFLWSVLNSTPALGVPSPSIGLPAVAGVGSNLCFVEGTLVHTQNGLKPIEKIEVGDLVASKNEFTGETTWKPVVQLFRNFDKEILNLTLVNAGGDTELLGVTAEHPFWVESIGWVNAANLQEGHRVLSVDDSYLNVKSVAADSQLHDTYNFEVAEYHTYFVGEQGAWVHNICGHLLSKSVQKAFKKNANLEKAFKAAIEKGVVGAAGQAGIKALKGNKKFTHEVKFLSREFGDVRVFGKKINDGSFEWLKVGNHKTL